MTTGNERADLRLKVLLVEDSLVDAHLIIAILDSESVYHVTLAQDGMRGTLLATEQDWDLIITDLNLPGDSGLDLIRTAKAHHPDTPILTTTGYTAPKYVQSALREGADDVLKKPIEKDDLLRKLLHLLGTARPDTAGSAARTVVAIGAEPGDVELGCGGILFGHREHHQRVVLVVMSDGPSPAGAREAEEAARMLDASVVFKTVEVPVDPDDDDAPGLGPLADVLADWMPDTLYVPSVHDRNERRVHAHRVGLMASGAVPNLYCYQTASSTTDFRPTLFVGVDDYLDGKIGLVGRYDALRKSNPAFSSDMVRSTARYWGRFDSFRSVEPLEVVRSEV